MTKMTRSEKIAYNKAEKRIDAAFTATSRGVLIPILEIPGIFKAGRAAIAAGADDAALAEAIKAAVTKVAVPKGGDEGMTFTTA